MSKRIAFAAALGLLTVFTASCTAAPTTVNTTPVTTGGASTTNGSTATTVTTTTAAATTTTKPVATIGSTLSLNDGSGNSFKVKLEQVTDPATPATQFDTAPSGDNLAEVLIKITGVKGNYNDDADSTVTVTGSDNQTYSAGFESIKGCTNFSSGTFTVTPGQSSTGCVAIEIKKHVKVAEVIYTPASGFGNSIGEWKVG